MQAEEMNAALTYQEIESEGNKTQPETKEAVKAGFWTRYFAYVLDCFLINAIRVAAVLFLMSNGMYGYSTGEKTVAVILLVLMSPAYHIGLTLLMGATPGKRAMRIVVVDLESGEEPDIWQLVYRETVGRGICILTLGIGYLLLFTKIGALHDRFSDTKVVYSI